jgi:hypothetical protein
MSYTQTLARAPRAAHSAFAVAAAAAAAPKRVRNVLKTVVAMCMSAVVTASPVSPSPSSLAPLDITTGVNWFHCTMNVVVEVTSPHFLTLFGKATAQNWHIMLWLRGCGEEL